MSTHFLPLKLKHPELIVVRVDEQGAYVESNFNSTRLVANVLREIADDLDPTQEPGGS